MSPSYPRPSRSFTLCRKVREGHLGQLQAKARGPGARQTSTAVSFLSCCTSAAPISSPMTPAASLCNAAKLEPLEWFAGKTWASSTGWPAVLSWLLLYCEYASALVKGQIQLGCIDCMQQLLCLLLLSSSCVSIMRFCVFSLWLCRSACCRQVRSVI